MEAEITTNATEYIYIEPSTCGNCKFWGLGSSFVIRENYKTCGRINEELDSPAYTVGYNESALMTKSEFSCSLHELKGEG